MARVAYPSRPAKETLWWVAHPLLPAAVVMSLAAAFALWAVLGAREARAAAQRVEQNLQRASATAEALSRTVPRHMPVGGAKTLVERLEGSLVAAGADRRAVRAVNVQSLGGLSDVPSARQQARVELADLTMRQVAIAIDAIESCGLPVWIESLDLSAAAVGDGADGWSAIIQVNWIAKAGDVPASPPSR